MSSLYCAQLCWSAAAALDHILTLSTLHCLQALRWSAKLQDDASVTGSSNDTAGSSDQQHRTQMHITLPDASYEPAAMAVLAGLYQVQPWPELFDSLTHQQQVQAAVLADMWHLPTARAAAMQRLRAAIDSAEGGTAVLDQLLSLPAMPYCLQALLEQALLRKFGDLEAVWGASAASSALQQSLLALPPAAMDLLLASSKLRVSQMLLMRLQ